MDMDTGSHNWLSFSLSNPSSYFLQHAADDGMGPKLEDFLGAGGGGGDQSIKFASGEVDTNNNNEIYVDSNDELRSIAAAGFLHAGTSSLPSDQDADISKMVVPEAKKPVDTFGQRTSIYRGVTRHRWTGRYEAHLWDNSCRREGQSRKGRQVYLGGYDKEDKAARAYDLAALKYWGPTTTTNFPVSNYEQELEEMKNMTRQEFVASLRRKSSGFSRGASIYRGVTRHHQHGRWQARIGRVAGNKDLYLGTFSTQEEAAEAYDIAAIKFRGLNAVTNFDMSRYDVKSIANSSLPIGGMAGRASKPDNSCSSSDNNTLNIIDANHQNDYQDSSSNISFSMLPINKQEQYHQDYYSLLAYQQQQQQYGMLASGVNMDFANNELVWSNGVLQHSQSVLNSNGSIPYATPISAGYDQQGQSYCMSNLVNNGGSSAAYYHEAAKSGSNNSNVSLFHSPLFGME